MRDFRKYDIWKLSHSLTLDVYQITSSFPQEERFGIVSQLRRSSSSVPTNISEGSGRQSEKEFGQFLNIALGSISETEYLLLLSKDLLYISSENFEQLSQKAKTIKSKIFKLKEKLN